MDVDDEAGSSGPNQNLHDLQNYLSTFNKEIEPGDDVLSNMDVDGGEGDDNDLYSTTSGNPLQESGEGGVPSQFSSGFYSEQGILDTPLSDESQQIQNLVAAADRDGDTDITTAIKQEVGSIDLDTVQAQIASFGESQLAQGVGDIQNATMTQGLIMTSLGDNLDPAAGKVIRIVSLGEDGQYLSLTNGSRMQILNQDLGISGDSLTTSDSALALPGNETTSVNSSCSPTVSVLSSSGVVMAARGASSSNSTTVVSSGSSRVPANTQVVAIQSTADNTPPQLVALPQGTALSTEALQMTGLLTSDASLGSDVAYQTITIVPSELSQAGDMNYVLIMASQDGQKSGAQTLAQMVDLKQENQEFSEELVEINGEVKRVLRVIPKKYIANFGTQLMCDYCDYTSSKRYLITRHMKSHSDERPHKCKECDRGFKTPASLLNHVNTHTGTRPHKCKTCEAAFTTSGELVRHIRYRHTFEKPHRCPNCDYASVELSKLKRHMRSHTGERPYKCPNCPYASPDTYKLKRHLRIHTGEKPYECDICHARFTQSNSLKAHKLIHSGNKPVFQCNLCPTTCGRKTDLKIHFNKLHSMGSPLECKKCGQVFSDRYTYKQHVRAHDIDKCFKCEECDFIANTERSFDVHAAIHSSGKKYECETCHSSFNLKQTLDRHKQNCTLSLESGMDSPSSSRDQESTDEESVDKSALYKTSVERPAQQSKGHALFSSETSSNSSLHSGSLTSGPLASDTLHKNLLQDIKAGKLGDVPQVVIVHPDGSLEEISSKLPAGDKLNLEEIFSALSSNEKPSGETEVNTDKEVSEGDDSNTEVAVSKKQQQLELSDSEEKEEQGECSQCEASTQAELESDTDSIEDSPPHKPPRSKLSHPVPAKSDPSSSQLITVSATTANGLPTTTSVTSSLSLSSLLPASVEQSLSSSNPQYVVVKGYTCLNSDTGQPTLVDVAVDKESLMKMFASLGGPGSTGMQLLTGDLDSSITIPLEGSQTNVLAMTPLQMHELTSLSNLSTGEEAQIVSENNISQDHNHSNSEDMLRHSLNLTVQGISSLSSSSDPSFKHLQDLGHSDSDNPIISENIMVDHSSIKDTALISPFTSLKVSLSNQQLNTDSLHSSEDGGTIKVSLSNQQLNTESLHASEDGGTIKVSLSEHQLVANPFLHSVDNTGQETSTESHMTLVQDLTESASSDTDNTCGSKQTLSTPYPVSSCDSSFFSNHVKSFESQRAEDESEDNFSVKESSSSLSQEKQKRLGRKRVSATDPSLVMTGKRVRKALVKVSL